MPRFFTGQEVDQLELRSVWESNRTADGAVLIPREVIKALFGRFGHIELGGASLIDMFPSTTLMVNLGNASHWFNDGYIYALNVNAGTGGATVRVGGVLDAFTTQSGNDGGGEDGLFNRTLPGGTLAADGDALRIMTSGVFANTANNKQLRIYVGGTMIFDSASLKFGLTAVTCWMTVTTVIRTGAETGKAGTTFTTDDGTLHDEAKYTDIAAEPWAGNAAIRVTGEAVGDNDIVAEFMQLVYEPAP